MFWGKKKKMKSKLIFWGLSFSSIYDMLQDGKFVLQVEKLVMKSSVWHLRKYKISNAAACCLQTALWSCNCRLFPAKIIKYLGVLRNKTLKCFAAYLDCCLSSDMVNPRPELIQEGIKDLRAELVYKIRLFSAKTLRRYDCLW